MFGYSSVKVLRALKNIASNLTNSRSYSLSTSENPEDYIQFVRRAFPTEASIHLVKVTERKFQVTTSWSDD